MLFSVMLVNLLLSFNSYIFERDALSTMFFSFNVITALLLVLVLAIKYPSKNEKGWEKPVLELVLCPAIGMLIACTFLISIVMCFANANTLSTPVNFPNYPIIFVSCISLTVIFAYGFYLKYYA